MKTEDLKSGEQEAMKAKMAEQAWQLPASSKKDEPFRAG